MNGTSLMQALEEVIRANLNLDRAVASGNLESIDDNMGSLDYALNELCKSIGVDMRHMERGL